MDGQVELAKAILKACTDHGVDHQHPGVRDACMAFHQEICDKMPHHNDAGRANEVMKRAPAIAAHIKSKVPQEPVQHFQLGGIAMKLAAPVLGAVAENTKPVQGGIADAASKFVDTTPTDQSQSLNDTTPPAVAENIASQNNPSARSSSDAKTKLLVGNFITGKSLEEDTPENRAKFNGNYEVVGGDSTKDVDNSGIVTKTKAHIHHLTPQELVDANPVPPQNSQHMGVIARPPAVAAPVTPQAPATGTPPAPAAAVPPTGTPPPVLPQVDVSANKLPNTFTQGQDMALDASTPVAGMAAGRQQAEDTARRYAADQTPEKMRAAQADKGSVLAGKLAGAGVAGDHAGVDSALDSLANLGSDNLKDQQGYGNNSLQELNKTGLDTQANQGAGIANANAAAGPGRATANDTLDQENTNTKNAVDYDQIQKAISAAGSLPSDVSQAIWAGEQAQTILALGSLKNATPKSKTAIAALITLLQKHPELRPASGITDAGSVKTMIDAQTAKNAADLETKRTKHGVATGVDVTPDLNATGPSANVSSTLNRGKPDPLNPQGYADGGEVTDEGADMPDTGDIEDSGLSGMDVLRKAFGMKSKAEDEGNAEATGGPKEEKVMQIDAVATKDDAVPPVDESLPGKPADSGSMKNPYADRSPVDDHSELITNKATERGIDPKIAHAIAMTESSGNANAMNKNRNGTSDYGLFQVNSSNLKPGEEEQAFDPEFNTSRGLDIYKEGLDRFNGNEAMALYSYNHGIRAAEKAGLAVAQRDPYVQRVLANKQST